MLSPVCSRIYGLACVYRRASRAPLPCPRDHFSTEDCREGTRRGEAGEEVKERDFFRLFSFAFALRRGSLIGEVNIYWLQWLVVGRYFFEGNLISR